MTAATHPHKGRPCTVKEIAADIGISEKALRERIRKHGAEKAIAMGAGFSASERGRRGAKATRRKFTFGRNSRGY